MAQTGMENIRAGRAKNPTARGPSGVGGTRLKARDISTNPSDVLRLWIKSALYWGKVQSGDCGVLQADVIAQFISRD